MHNISVVCIVCFCATLILSVTPVSGQNTTNKIDDNEMGMGILFDMVNTFLGDVIHKKRIGESFLNLSKVFEDGEFHGEEVDDWRKWLDYLIGFTVCAAIGIVFIVVMPVVGIIFCCCRMCGRCGAKPEKSASKRATCKRRSYCTVLMILSTVALAGVVCAFICNNLFYKHLQNDNNEGTVGHVNQSFHQIEAFINNSVNGYSDYVNDTYKNTSQEIMLRVNDSATQAVESVLEQLQAVALLANAKEISKEANRTKHDLDEISILLSELSNDSKQLKQNLTEIRDSVIVVCNRTSNCQGFDPSQYETDADFSSLDRLSNETSKVAQALDMQKYINQAEQSLADAKKRAHEQVGSKIDEAIKAITDVERQVDSGISDLQREKNKLLENFPTLYDKINDGNDDMKKYSKYVYYGGIGVCCVYLLILVLYYIGILFGMCGEKPGDGAPCCNTGCGANFLISGVAFTFILSWILMIICVILFCIGGPVYTEGCRYFQGHDPAQLKDFDDVIKNAINVKDYYSQTPPDFSVSGIIQNCQEDKALFSALQLDPYIVDLNKTLDIKQLEEKLEDLKKTTFDLDNVTIISGNLNNSLTNLANSGLESVNFTHYFTELSKQLTVGSLSDMAILLRALAGKQNESAARSDLNISAARLQTLHDQDLPEIKEKVSMLNSTLIDLQQKSSIKDDIIKLIENLHDAEVNFNTNKNKLIKDQIEKLASDIVNLTSFRINTVKKEVRENMYKCQNLSNALFTISDAVCLQTVEPLNGLWFSFGWCLFFFVPCLIFAILLAGQYRRTLEDDKEFDDPNYMMYGGPNPDTIPLTSVDRSSGSSAYPGSGMFNAGYRDESKRTPYADPPPYDAHMRSAWRGDDPRAQTQTAYNYGRNIY